MPVSFTLRNPLPDEAIPAIRAGMARCPDDYCWVAVYQNDGAEPRYLAEYDVVDDHSFAQIDQSRLGAFLLIPLYDDLRPVGFEPRPGKRLIFFRRRGIVLEMSGSAQEQERYSLTVVGWQETVNGRNVKSLHVVYPDGSVYVATDNDF